MAAMNDGASDEGGHIVGVIHEMFVVDGSDWVSEEGGAHSAFHGGGREILVAGGNDLQERKRLLVEGADALVVLPGGPGTWDEVGSFGMQHTSLNAGETTMWMCPLLTYFFMSLE